MQQTFKKMINSHYIQFNRLLYPLRYAVKCDDDNSDGKQLEIKKDTNGNWILDPDAPGVPEWCVDAVPLITEAINENESIQFASF